MITAQPHILVTAVGPHLFWIASRAAGIAALLLSSLSVCLGLLMGRGIAKGHRADLRVAHEALSLATLTAIVVHGLALLGDGNLHPSLGDLTIPFLSGYKALWTSIGIVSSWMLAALGLSYYARTRIGMQRWRVLHRFTALAWVLGLAHSLGEGTDAGQVWFLAMTAIVAVPAIALLLARVSRIGASPSATSQAAPARRQHTSGTLSGTALPPARLEQP